MRTATFYCGFGFFCLIFGGTLTVASDHHDDRGESEDDDEQLVSCFYYLHGDNTQQTDVMFCEHGCCGTLEDQKCCQNRDHERGLSVSYIILLSVAGLFAVVIVTITVTCVYKHKQSVNKRQTSPVDVWHTDGLAKVAPQNLFYTEYDSKGRKDEKTPQAFTEVMNNSLADMLPTSQPKNNEYFVNMRTASPPPRYSERESETETEVTPSLNGNQPPPYTVAVSMMPPSVKEL